MNADGVSFCTNLFECIRYVSCVRTEASYIRYVFKFGWMRVHGPTEGICIFHRGAGRRFQLAPKYRKKTSTTTTEFYSHDDI